MKTIDIIPDINEESLSKPAPESIYNRQSNATRKECFSRCVENAFEMKSEFVCASACMVDRSAPNS
jgi:hypothetical protein